MVSEVMIASEHEGLSADTLKVGIIGTGAIAQRLHIPEVKSNENADIVAVCDIEEKKAAAVAEAHSIPEYYTDYTTLFDGKVVDAIIVCLPNHLHRDVVVAALRNDIHVLCEKPISTSLSAADDMVTAAAESDGILMIDQSERFDPVYEKTKDIIDQGIIGEIHNVRSRFSHPGPEGWSPRSSWFTDASASGGGALVDIGIHNADLINHLFGSVDELMGYSDTLSMDVEVEDTAVAVLRFADDKLGTFETAWRTDPESIEMQIVGEGGVIYADKIANSIQVEFADDSGTLEVPVPEESKYGGPIAHFIDSALTGNEPVVTGRDGREALEIVMGVYRSSTDGQAVHLPLTREGDE